MKVILKLILVKMMMLALILPIVACSYDAKKVAIIFGNNTAGIYDNATTASIYQAMTKFLPEYRTINNRSYNTNEINFWKTLLIDNLNEKTKYFVILNHNFLTNINNLMTELKENVVTGNKIIILDYENQTIKETEISNLIMVKFDLLKMGYNLGYYTGQHLLTEAANINNNEPLKVSAITYQDDLVAQRLISGWQRGLMAAQKENPTKKIIVIDPIAKINRYLAMNHKTLGLKMEFITQKLLAANVKVIFDPLSWHRDSLMSAFLNTKTNNNSYLVTMDVINEHKFEVNGKNFLLGYVNRNFTPALQTIALGNHLELLDDFSFNSALLGVKPLRNWQHDQFDSQRFLWNEMPCNDVNAPLSKHFCQDGA